MLYNQWCSVIRWEKTTRPFLRSREFWWQEGHTIHETAEEAEAETEQQLELLRRLLSRTPWPSPSSPAARPIRKSSPARRPPTPCECMMKDHKALQGATSHYFGDKFSRAYDVTFTGRDNKAAVSRSRPPGAPPPGMIGAVIMAHGDNNGLVLPPKIAPIQVVVIPVAAA